MQQTDCKPIAHSNGAKETEASKATGDKQRIYDAMLIRAFRKDVRITDLAMWLKPYGIDLSECGLKRIPEYLYYPLRVRVMVGKFLKPLADRLWDTEPMNDIKTLDWMKNLNCQQIGLRYESELARLGKNSNNARRKTKILGSAIAGSRKNNQWNVVK